MYVYVKITTEVRDKIKPISFEYNLWHHQGQSKIFYVLGKSIKLCYFNYYNIFFTFFIAKDLFMINVFYKNIFNKINQSELK